ENKLQQKARYCFSGEREFARLLSITRESESNLRARAYYALNDDDASLLATVLEAGLSDEDWRVRAVVTNRLQHVDAILAEGILLKALRDPHPEVQSIACKNLGSFKSQAAFEAMLKIVKNTPLTPVNFGLLKNALEGLRYAVGWKNAAGIVEERADEEGFPFPNEAAKVIKVLKRRPTRD
ncbi:hypothetical protein EON80_15645, partial [bacterium]